METTAPKKTYDYEPEHDGLCSICKKETKVARRQWKPNHMMPLITSEQPICGQCIENIINMVH